MSTPVLMTAAALASTAPPLPGFLNALASPLQHYGIWAIGFLILLEDFGVPVPGETIMIAGALYAGAGRLNIVAVGVVAFIAAIIGDNIGFAIGHFGGRAVALRLGKYVFITPERLDKAEDFFDRHGGKVITIARFIEGLRQANGIIAGISGMHWRRFLAFNALGAALWVGTWVSLGYFAGNHINTIYHSITLYSYYVLIAVAVLIVGYIVVRLRVRRRILGPRAAGQADEADESRSTSEATETAPGEHVAAGITPGEYIAEKIAPGEDEAEEVARSEHEAAWTAPDEHEAAEHEAAEHEAAEHEAAEIAPGDHEAVDHEAAGVAPGERARGQHAPDRNPPDMS